MARATHHQQEAENLVKMPNLDHGVAYNKEDGITDAEWRQLEQDIIDFINSDPTSDDGQEFINDHEKDIINFLDLDNNHDNKEFDNINLDSSHETDDDSDDEYYSFHLASQTDEIFVLETSGRIMSRLESPHHAQETAMDISRLERALRRSWTLGDTMKIFTRAILSTDSSFDQDYLRRDNYGYNNYMLQRAIRQELESLLAGGKLGPEWNEDNMVSLFFVLVQEVENFMSRWSRTLEALLGLGQRIELTRMIQSGGLLSLETMVNCVQTRVIVGDDDGEIICVVCQDQLYKEKETIATLECGHEYHVDCIKQWLLRGKSVCPVCKAKALPIDD